jgi:hypothetical protein
LCAADGVLAARLHLLHLLSVQGRLVTASREYKGGFFSKVKASLDSSHKKSFRVRAGQPPANSSSSTGIHEQQQQQEQQWAPGFLELQMACVFAWCGSCVVQAFHAWCWRSSGVDV